jgi:hypothetical protein
MSNKNAINPLLLLSKFERMQEVRNMPAVRPDQVHSTADHKGDSTGRQDMLATLGASQNGQDNFGGRATAKTAPSGKVGPFPFQLEGNQYDH